MQARLKENTESPLARCMDDETFNRVEADLMKKHKQELGGPPDEGDAECLARHLLWWARQHPGGDINYSDPVNVAEHLLNFHANRLLMQRVERLSPDDRRTPPSPSPAAAEAGRKPHLRQQKMTSTCTRMPDIGFNMTKNSKRIVRAITRRSKSWGWKVDASSRVPAVASAASYASSVASLTTAPQPPKAAKK
jgi:hypothetical protein